MIELIPKERWGELDWSEWGEMPIKGEVWGYVQGGKVLGHYLVERNQTHVGAFTVRPEHRGNGIASALAQHAYDTLKDEFYVAATTPQTRAMCERFGLTEIDGTLFVKE